MKRILVTGAQGQLGRALQLAAGDEFDLRPFGSQGLNIADRPSVLAVVRELAPDVVINAAAYTAVDRAENEPEKAREVNELGPKHLAEACLRQNARLIHVSTDYVFDGCASRPYAPDHAPNPQGVYGATKLAGEQAVLRGLPDQASVVRTAWLYGPQAPNFVFTMLRLMAERDDLGVVCDQIGAPTSTRSLAAALLSLVRTDQGRGHILHWTDAGVASWFDFACAIHAWASRTQPARTWARPRPIPTSAFPTPAVRPHYSVLDCSLAQDMLGLPRHWQAELMHVLDTLD